MSVSSDSTITDRTSGNRQPVAVGEGSGSSVIAAPRISPTDGELLTLFVRHDDRAALDRLVDRHAAMVWRVCRATLRRSQDAEDAFQATFLLLVRSARSIKSSDSAAGWLYRVAYRTSLRARKKLAARREESLAVDPDAPGEAAFPDLLRRQTTGVLVEELMRLPAKYQTPLVMRYLEGQSRRAIADQTDTTIATVQGQLARGKQMLRHRLLRRGVSLATTMAALGLGARGAQAAESAPAHLIASTTSHSVVLASGGSLAASAAIVSLYQEGARAMLIAWLGKPAASIVAAAVVALMLFPNAPAGEGAGFAAPEPLSLKLALDREPGGSQLDPILQLAQAQLEPPALAAGDSPTDPTPNKPASPRRQSGENQPAPAPTTGVVGSPPPESRNEPTLAFNDHPEISVWGGASEHSLAGAVWIDAAGTAQLGQPIDTTGERVGWLKPIDEIGGLTLEQAANRIATELRERTGDRRLRVRLSHKLLGVAGNGQLSAAAPPATAPQPPAAPPKTSPPVPPQPPAAAAPQLTPLRAPEGGGAGKYAERNREYGWSVQQLQERLNTRLNPSPDIDADGDYGPKTEGAVKRFQRQNGLPVTGFADKATVSTMGLGRVENSAGSMPIADLDRSIDRITALINKADSLAKRAHELFIANRNSVTNAIFQASLPTPSWSELQSLGAPEPLERALWIKAQTLYRTASDQIDEVSQKAAELLGTVDPDEKSSFDWLERLSMQVMRVAELKQRSPLERSEDANAYFAAVWNELYAPKAYFKVAEAVTGKASFSTVEYSIRQLKEFQQRRGLKPTGEFNEATWNALFGLGDQSSDQQPETSAAGRQREPSASAADKPPVDPPTTGVAGSPLPEEATPNEPEPAALDQIEHRMATAEAESAKLVSLAQQTLKMLAFEKPGKTSLIGDTFSNESRIVNAPLTNALVETGRQQRALAEQAYAAAQQAIKEYGKERLQSATSEADVAAIVASLQADLGELNQRLKSLHDDHASVPVILSGREAVSTPRTQSEPSKAKPKLSDKEIGARLAEGWRKFFAQDAKGAEEAFRDVLQIQPDNRSGTNGLAFCLLNRGEPAKAEPLFKKLLIEEPNAPGPLNGLARCLQARGDTDGAIDAWEKSRSGMPPGQPSAATAALARVYSERADWAKARPLLKEMVASNPGAEPYAGWLKKAKAATADADNKKATPVATAGPSLASTIPKRDATEVDPGLKEIRITFDRDMGRGMSWTGSKETGMPPLAAGRSARWIDKRTCVLRLGKLEPGRAYRVGINAPSYKNFKSADGTPAAIDELKFTTSSEEVPTASRRRQSSEVSRTGTTPPTGVGGSPGVSK